MWRKWELISLGEHKEPRLPAGTAKVTMTTECLEKSGLVSPTEVTRAVRKGEETPETVTETHRESLESKVRGNGFPLDVF